MHTENVVSLLYPGVKHAIYICITTVQKFAQ